VRLYLKVFNHNGLDGHIVQSTLDKVAASKYDYRVDFKPIQACVDVARAAVVEEARQWGAEIVIMQDHDMVYNYGALDHIVDLAKTEEALISVCYSKRELHGGPCWAMFDGKYHETGSDEVFEVKDGSFVGAGLWAIPIQVFGDVSQFVPDCVPVTAGYKTFFLPKVYSRQWKGESVNVQFNEDFAFCDRVRDAGRRILVTMKPVVGHVGKFTYSPVEANLGHIVKSKKGEQ